MSRLIYEDDVIKMLDRGWLSGKYPHTYEVHNLPTAQPEIIRCKDCKFYREYGCQRAFVYPEPEDFCSRAERREEHD